MTQQTEQQAHPGKETPLQEASASVNIPAVGRSTIFTRRLPQETMTRAQAHRYRRASDVQTRWWQRLRAIILLVSLVTVLGITIAALSGAVITVFTTLVERVMS